MYSLTPNIVYKRKHFTDKYIKGCQIQFDLKYILPNMGYLNFNHPSELLISSSKYFSVVFSIFLVPAFRGMYGLFGSGEMTAHGYVLDVTNKDAPCSRIPFIITDGNFICGRRMVLGANNLAVASQLVATLLIAQKDATESIESPRFHILGNETIGVEGNYNIFFYFDGNYSIK